MNIIFRNDSRPDTRNPEQSPPHNLRDPRTEHALTNLNGTLTVRTNATLAFRSAQAYGHERSSTCCPHRAAQWAGGQGVTPSIPLRSLGRSSVYYPVVSRTQGTPSTVPGRYSVYYPTSLRRWSTRR